MTALLRILYDGDDQGGRRFLHSDDGVRNPDNLVWARDGHIYIQEAMAKIEEPLFGSHSQEEASIWRLDPESEKVGRIAQFDRSAGRTFGTDTSPTRIGAWESSGILDVSHWLAQKKTPKEFF